MKLINVIAVTVSCGRLLIDSELAVNNRKVPGKELLEAVSELIFIGLGNSDPRSDDTRPRTWRSG